MKHGVSVCEKRSRGQGGMCLAETKLYYERSAIEMGIGDTRWPDNTPIFLCGKCAKKRKPIGDINS